jgi:hypothetical protein
MDFGVQNILSEMQPLSNNNYDSLFSAMGFILPRNINP